MSEETYEIGTAVKWSEGEEEHAGTVAEIYTEPVTLEIAGTPASKDASPDAPAYLVSISGNQRTIKSHDELAEVE